MRAIIAGGLLLLLVITGTAIVAVMRPAQSVSGPAIKESRETGPFKHIQSNGFIQLVIDAKPGAPGVVIEGPRDAVERVTVAVAGDTLTIAQKPGGDGGGRLTARISAPSLAGVSTLGSGDVTVHNLNSPDFSLNVAGSGDASISGRTGALTISVEGTGDVDASSLDAHDATVTIAGTGDVKVRADSSLDGSVNGTGDLTYFGNPAHVTRSVNGLGSIKAG